MHEYRPTARASTRKLSNCAPPEPKRFCGLLLAPLAPTSADPAPAIHYAPAENLEHVDVALIDGAEHEIDLAAYILTDWPIMQALTRAADRGVKVRIYLDGTQFAERRFVKPFHEPRRDVRR